MRLDHLATYHNRELNVVVETPRGSRAKYAYDPETGLFVVGKLLPLGLAFPFNFGFVPSTIGGDGDPMDALVATDEALVTGCLVRCRILGVLEMRKTKDGRKVKDDRLVVVPAVERGLAHLKSLEDLGDAVHDFEQFFVSYFRTHGKPLAILGRGGPARAATLLKAALR